MKVNTIHCRPSIEPCGPLSPSCTSTARMNSTVESKATRTGVLASVVRVCQRLATSLGLMPSGLAAQAPRAEIAELPCASTKPAIDDSLLQQQSVAVPTQTGIKQTLGRGTSPSTPGMFNFTQRDRQLIMLPGQEHAAIVDDQHWAAIAGPKLIDEQTLGFVAADDFGLDTAHISADDSLLLRDRAFNVVADRYFQASRPSTERLDDGYGMDSGLEEEFAVALSSATAEPLASLRALVTEAAQPMRPLDLAVGISPTSGTQVSSPSAAIAPDFARHPVAAWRPRLRDDPTHQRPPDPERIGDPPGTDLPQHEQRSPDRQGQQPRRSLIHLIPKQTQTHTTPSPRTTMSAATSFTKPTVTTGRPRPVIAKGIMALWQDLRCRRVVFGAAMMATISLVTDAPTETRHESGQCTNYLLEVQA
jgi:hypothetical protein